MDSETIHLGLSDMLGSLHDGQTLDSVIREISDGKFEDTVAFEKQFIKGTAGADGAYTGDAESLDFCVTFLNYMLDLYNDEDMAYGGNGSILKDFDEDYDSPLDPEKTAESDLFKIVESNEYVDSTVDRWADGGKSLSGDPAYNEAQEANASAEAGEEGTSAPLDADAEAAPEVSEDEAVVDADAEHISEVSENGTACDDDGVENSDVSEFDEGDSFTADESQSEADIDTIEAAE